MSVSLSGPPTALAPFPPETLLRILSFVKDDETFKDIVLSSRQFHVLGKEELTRDMDWKKAEDVEPRLAEWRENPRRHRVKALNLRLFNYDHDFLVQRNIFASLDIFSNLSCLTIRNGRITSHIHTTVTQLQNLRQLRLMWCGIYAFERTNAPPATPFTVTSLVLHEVGSFDRAGQHLESLGPDALRARNLTLMPLALLSGLRSLTVSSEKSSWRVMQQAYCLLPDTRNLVDLKVTGPPSVEDPGPKPLPVLVVPLLTTFSGPHYIAASLMRSATQIAKVILTDDISAQQALQVIENLHPVGVRNIELTLEHWDADVLHEIAHRFTQCTRIKLVHRYWGPSDDFLFNFGVHHLPRTQIDTLLIHARPEDAVRQPPSLHTRFFADGFGHYSAKIRKWEADGAAGLRHVPPLPSEEDVREYFAVWVRYNPRLEVVSIGNRLWTRDVRGTVWTAGEEAEVEAEAA
ncbi:hypothetical protein DFH07DRAFT_309217 [Mycena maculata]|uniref:F-box domain-containing protein n=1 Tax=Mycena maculata TaxID=230809 RepID=A0AAD7MJU5_9AGAR|nr:hypothetical protein DFH07DRAFT_309217 [Mycena maculata]